MAQTAADYLRSVDNKKAVLVFSHLSILTEQTYARFRKRQPHLSIGIMQGKKQPYFMNDVVITTMQTARSAKHIESMRQILTKPVGLLMIDETHMLPTTSYEIIRSYFPDVPLIGYTATPFREKKIMTNAFDKVSYTVSLQELIDQGHLVAPDLKQIQSKGKTDAEVISQVLYLYLANETNSQAIIYMRTIAEAEAMRNALETIGVIARTVTSKTNADARSEIFASFRAGITKVLTTVDVLTAGFDAPEVEAIFMPFGTKSPTQYLQRVGRGLRPSQGKTTCRVYMFGDAPEVQAAYFQSLNTMVLKAGTAKGHDTFSEDLKLTLWAKNDETYTWTQTVVEAVHQMKKIGMTNFAQLLDQKRFPESYMKSIRLLLDRLPKKGSTMPHKNKLATENQKSILFDRGFPSDVCSVITRGEASLMIATIFNKSNNPKGDVGNFVVPEGLHEGKHVSELPHSYRSAVKKKHPDSPTAVVIKAWEERRRTA